MVTRVPTCPCAGASGVKQTPSACTNVVWKRVKNAIIAAVTEITVILVGPRDRILVGSA